MLYFPTVLSFSNPASNAQAKKRQGLVESGHKNPYWYIASRSRRRRVIGRVSSESRVESCRHIHRVLVQVDFGRVTRSEKRAMAQVAVVQGSSKGIGLALTRYLLKNTQLKVVATSRTPKQARERILVGLGDPDRLGDRLVDVEMDVQKEESIAKAAGLVDARFGRSMRLLINVSGVLLPEKSILKINKEEMQRTFEINTFGHLLTYKHFLPLLPTKADLKQESLPDLSKGVIMPGFNVLASLSARVGSIGDNSLGGWYSYRSSKTALNQIIVTLQRELAARSSISPTLTVALHPGTVAGTELSKAFVPKEKSGTKQGIHDADAAAKSLLDVLSKLGKGDGGQFLDYKGEQIQW